MDRPDLTDHELDALLAGAKRDWGADGPADPDGLWDAIETDAFGKTSTTPAARRTWWRAPSWRVTALAAGVALVAGTGLGRLSVGATANGGTMNGGTMNGGTMNGGTTDAQMPAVAVDPERDAGPAGEAQLDATTVLYFGDAEALLTALDTETDPGMVSDRFAGEAASLLAVTRILLDAPSSTDPTLRALLDDLELVLAQIARLPADDDASELAFIAAAIEGNDVVPRLQLAVAEYDYTAP